MYQQMFGYQPFGTARKLLESGDDRERAMGENIAGEYGRALARDRHEMGLQQQEQSRRQYDSETARRKAGILGGLLTGRIGGM